MTQICIKFPRTDFLTGEERSRSCGTDDGRNMEEVSQLLSDAINSIIDVKEESDIDSLFSAGGTSALMSEINGLDDFELICFLVVK